MDLHKKNKEELLIALKEYEDKYLSLFDQSKKETIKYKDLEHKLVLVNKELTHQNNEKGKRAEELVVANEELIFQNNEKENRASELIIANKELVYQNNEKVKRANELVIANKELAYQNGEKQKRADELIIANKELVYQNNEKAKRADELAIANTELAYQNKEKEKRATELIIANKELVYQNNEKVKRADELNIANCELAFQNSEKEKRAEELQAALENAKESDRLKSAFLANMSHEIRTPMNGILGFASLLKEADLTGNEQQEYIQLIEESGDRLLSLIEDIIDISKIESGAMEVNLRRFNINEQINALHSFFQNEMESKKIIFVCTKPLSDEKAFIYSDRSKTYAILFNLIKNAIENSPEGTIELGYNTIGTNNELSFQFWIKDNGKGIPIHRQEAIFERFIKVDIDNKMAMQGAGLGLYISKAFVELLGGEIWLESEINKGATFYFTIPPYPPRS